VLVIAILTGFACTRMGPFGDRAAAAMSDLAKLFFGIIHVVVKLAPLGAFGAMGFTIGKYGSPAWCSWARWWPPSTSPPWCSCWWCWA
jgi:Na+/H+-dicarboxylate symporter